MQAQAPTLQVCDHRRVFLLRRRKSLLHSSAFRLSLSSVNRDGSKGCATSATSYSDLPESKRSALAQPATHYNAPSPGKKFAYICGLLPLSRPPLVSEVLQARAPVRSCAALSVPATVLSTVFTNMVSSRSTSAKSWSDSMISASCQRALSSAGPLSVSFVFVRNSVGPQTSFVAVFRPGCT